MNRHNLQPVVERKRKQELMDMVEKPPVEEAPSRMAVLGATSLRRRFLRS